MSNEILHDRRGVISDGVAFILKRDIEPQLLDQYCRRRERYPEYAQAALRNVVQRTTAPIRDFNSMSSGEYNDSVLMNNWLRLYKSQQT